VEFSRWRSEHTLPATGATLCFLFWSSRRLPNPMVYALVIGATRNTLMLFGLSLAMSFSDRSVELTYDVYSTCWPLPRASTTKDYLLIDI
jgi:hypothetical protein